MLFRWIGRLYIVVKEPFCKIYDYISIMLRSFELCLILLLFGSHTVAAQGFIRHFVPESGYFELRGARGFGGMSFIQGSVGSGFSFDGWPLAANARDDVFFGIVDGTGSLFWIEVDGGGGQERLSGPPVVSRGGKLLFFGEAVDSLRLGPYSHRAQVNSFFSFAGIRDNMFDIAAVRVFESEGPLRLTVAEWHTDGGFYLGGRAEEAVLMDGDTVAASRSGPYAFVLYFDASWTFAGSAIMEGEAVPFDIFHENDQLYIGLNFRDLLQMDGRVIQGRVQDYDCLVTSRSSDLSELRWYDKLGGVHDKTGVRMLSDPASSELLVTGNFIGVITDGTGRRVESRGLETDIFVWKYDSGGGPVEAYKTGGTMGEQLLDGYMEAGEFRALVQFDDSMDVFGVQRRLSTPGRGLAVISIAGTGTGRLEELYTGSPEVFGFDLWPGEPGHWHVSGAFSGALKDKHGSVRLTQQSPASADFFIASNTWKTVGFRTDESRPVRIFPNPFRENLYLSGLPENESVELSVVSSDGKLVRKEQGIFYEGMPILHGDGLPPGVYFVLIKSQTRHYQERLIVH